MFKKIHIEFYKTMGEGQRPFINFIKKKQEIWYWMASLTNGEEAL